ncbi:hypothetical protein HNR19_002168 [Nocardioides thalensis]|uniref:Uncharacterized protein n=1 Tax=Nocardioides thalensis TaxID=1914755 RepID=A0A853BZS4_9ACTN|nr:hypothetical protein [Nocardioides thalensis]NYJ01470.1 hypothetical protein [Nocardioides thalensis]
MATARTTRYQCCVCGDPATLSAPDYVELTVQAPDLDGHQWLGAHRSCLNRVFNVEIIIGE